MGHTKVLSRLHFRVTNIKITSQSCSVPFLKKTRPFHVSLLLPFMHTSVKRVSSRRIGDLHGSCFTAEEIIRFHVQRQNQSLYRCRPLVKIARPARRLLEKHSSGSDELSTSIPTNRAYPNRPSSFVCLFFQNEKIQSTFTHSNTFQIEAYRTSQYTLLRNAFRPC